VLNTATQVQHKTLIAAAARLSLQSKYCCLAANVAPLLAAGTFHTDQSGVLRFSGRVLRHAGVVAGVGRRPETNKREEGTKVENVRRYLDEFVVARRRGGGGGG
jgi:hypothetical protein